MPRMDMDVGSSRHTDHAVHTLEYLCYSLLARHCPSEIRVQLTLMLLVANLANTKRCKKPRKITETLANGYSSESTQRELSNEYQDDRVSMFFQES